MINHCLGIYGDGGRLCRGPVEPWLAAQLRGAWREAQAEAVKAYRGWRGTRGADLYAVYRAAQDRADAAQDALAVRVGGLRR